MSNIKQNPSSLFIYNTLDRGRRFVSILWAYVEPDARGGNEFQFGLSDRECVTPKACANLLILVDEQGRCRILSAFSG